MKPTTCFAPAHILLPSDVWSGTLSVRSGPSANAGSRQPHSSTSTMHSAAARSVSRLRSSRSRIQQPSFILAPGGDEGGQTLRSDEGFHLPAC